MKTAAFFGTFCLVLGSMLSCGGSPSLQQSNSASGFRQANLVADVAGRASHIDPGLVNPWGIAFAPGQPFFIADNNRGSAKVFDPSGTPALPLAIVIPVPSGSAPPSRPSAVSFNPIGQDFLIRGTPAQFLFTTEEGTVSTWAPINGNTRLPPSWEWMIRRAVPYREDWRF